MRKKVYKETPIAELAKLLREEEEWLASYKAAYDLEKKWRGQLQEEIERRDAEIEQLRDIQSLFIEYMKRRSAMHGYSEWDVICLSYPYLKELEKTWATTEER